MFNRSKSHRKTCWSVLMNFISEASPAKLLVGYLYAYSQLNSANAQQPETFYYGSTWAPNVPKSACITAAPGCLLTVKGLFSEGELRGFDVLQQCGDDKYRIETATLEEQFKLKTFYGDKLCNETITSAVKFDNPLVTRAAHNTDYAIKLEKEDAVTIKYSP